MTTYEAQFRRVSDKEHARRKSMWLGSGKVVLSNILFLIEDDDGNKAMENKDLEYPPAVYKCFDEIIVNALDQYKRMQKKRNKVTEISCTFDIDTGKVSIFNNGPGIPVVIHKKEKMYIPQLIFGEKQAGSNNDTDTERTTGGTNGLGSTLVGLVSDEFVIQTLDNISEVEGAKINKYYYQKFEDGNDTKHPPLILDFNDSKSSEYKKAQKKLKKEEHVKLTAAIKKKGFTQVSYKINYETFYKKAYSKEIGEILNGLFRTRVYLAAAYAPTVKFTYNSEVVKINSMKDIVEMTDVTGPIIHETINNKAKSRPWDVYVSTHDGTSGMKQITIINGIWAKEGGTHLDTIIKRIVKEIKPKAEKLLNGAKQFRKPMVTNQLFIAVVGEIPTEQCDWEGQQKYKLRIEEKIMNEYEFSKKFYKKVWEQIQESIVKEYFNKISDIPTTKKKSQITGIKKFTDAEKAGTAKSHMCMVFIPEGDSAQIFVEKGIRDKECDLSPKYCGIFNNGGVTTNILKEVTYNKEQNVNEKSKMLRNSERFNSLVKILNLNENYHYDMTSTGRKQFKTLRYGVIIICTDQDVDGIGQICSLILVIFYVFWPNLIKRGFLKRFATPLIRAIPKKKTKKGKKIVLDFYSYDKFEEWQTSNPTICSDYSIEYYKGLATHSKAETTSMFQNFETNLYTYVFDENSKKAFEIYFGKNTFKRKKVLATPLEKRLPIIDNKIDCSEHLHKEAKEFQLDNILRSIPHIIDGLNPSRRKILCGGIKHSNSNNSSLKVFQLGGIVANSMGYHHGGDSLNKTIISMTSDYPGARNIPLFLPVSNNGFGSRLSKKKGAPRYINTKLNRKLVDLLFPYQDHSLLKYVVSDGKKVEPQYYVPIFPIILIEKTTAPATGWATSIYPRDFEAIFKTVKKMIGTAATGKSLDKFKYPQLEFWSHRFDGKIVKSDTAKEILIGSYEHNIKKKTVRITELPLYMYVDKFIEDIMKKTIKVNGDVVALVDGEPIHGKDGDIDITFTLNVSYEDMKNAQRSKFKQWLDPIEECFKLYNDIDKNINVVNIDGSVRECEEYTEILLIWFNERKQLYKKRIDREIIMTERRIAMLKNIIRFTDENIDISKKSEEKSNDILDGKGFEIFNKSVIDTPGDLVGDELEDALDSNRSYDYIMSLRYKDTLKRPCELRATKLKELKLYLRDLENQEGFPGMKTWLSKLDDLKELINSNNDGWYHEDSGYTYTQK